MSTSTLLSPVPAAPQVPARQPGLRTFRHETEEVIPPSVLACCCVGVNQSMRTWTGLLHTSAVSVSAQLSALAQATGTPAGALIQYTEISDALVSLGAADPAMSAVVQLDDDALAVLGALIELTDGSSPGVDAEQALLYAQRTFGTDGDLSTA